MSEFTPNDAFGLLHSYSRHRDYVRLALLRVIHDLEARSMEHDASKMLDDEFAGFARINAVARVHKFGSPEYKESMKQERGTIDLHFSRNSHHPERPTLLAEAAEIERGLPDDATYWEARDGARMTFLDVIEMVCDWWGARRGYNDSRMTWHESVTMNLELKCYCRACRPRGRREPRSDEGAPSLSGTCEVSPLLALPLSSTS